MKEITNLYKTGYYKPTKNYCLKKIEGKSRENDVKINAEEILERYLVPKCRAS